MVIQYIIDWHYVSKLVFVRADDAVLPDDTSRIELLVERLRAIKDRIYLNGLMPVDKRNSWTRQLSQLVQRVHAARDRVSIDNTFCSEDKKVWMSLLLLLDAFNGSAYNDRVVRIETSSAVNVKECVRQCRQFLDRQGLKKVRTVVLSDVADVGGGTFEYVTLDHYWHSSTEALREKWEHNVSFAPGEEDSFAEYLAGIVLSSLPMQAPTITLYDPYWSLKLFSGSAVDRRWLNAARLLVMTFAGSPLVSEVTFVSEEPDGSEDERDWSKRKASALATLKMHDFQQALLAEVERTRLRTAAPLRVGVRLRRKSRDFHNRYVETGLACCLVPDGLDFFSPDRRSPNEFKIAKTFECCLWNSKESIELAAINNADTLFTRSLVRVDESNGIIPVPQVSTDVATFIFRGRREVCA